MWYPIRIEKTGACPPHVGRRRRRAAEGDAGDPEASAWTGASRHPAEHEQPGIVILEPGLDDGGGAAVQVDAGDPDTSARTGASQHPAEHERTGSIVLEPG